MVMRSFFCLELDQITKDRLADAVAILKKTDARMRWVRPELMHITLKFLGDIDPNQIIEYQSFAQSAANKSQPFQLRLNKLGAFPNFDKPRVIWAGASNVPDALNQLHATLDQQLETFGFRREKLYTPHVTLGRVKESDKNLLSTLAELVQSTSMRPSAFKVNGITLMGSVLGSGGPSYTPVFQVPL